MASKGTHKADGAKRPDPSGASALAEVERLIAKDRLKDAVKQAKLAFRAGGTEPARRLLERAYLLRAQQLLRDGMAESAREVAGHLLEFGVSDPRLKEEAAALFLAVGLTRAALTIQEGLDSPEARDRLVREAADLAVLHPERADAGLPEVREGALRVRSALEAVEAGDEPRAAELLREVARSSPFADWKLFARGLAAHRRGDAAEAQANWGRLQPGRAAARIVSRLGALSAAGGAGEADLGPLEHRVFGAPVLSALRQVRELAAEDRWEEAFRVLGPLRFALRAVDPALAERLTRILYEPVMRAAADLPLDEARRLIDHWARVAEPLPIDPRWNRLWALLWEEAQGEAEGAENHWKKYLRDLDALPALDPEGRVLARALVWKHMGEARHRGAREIEGPPELGRPSGAALKEAARQRALAVEYLEESLRLRPDHRATYHALARVHNEAGRPEQAAAVMRRLVAVAPDDFDALMDLAAFHYQRNEPALMLPYVQRARALKPLDRDAVSREWAAHAMLARAHALAGRFEEGRAELAAAEAASAALSGDGHFLARRAALELRAGDARRAEDAIARGLEQPGEPAPFWLSLLIEGRRHLLEKEHLERFEARWLAALVRKPAADTAGVVADLVGGFVAGKVDYPGRDEHVRQVLDYIRKTTRLKYSKGALTSVCAFLSLQLPAERALLEKMVARGLKLYPDSASFPSMAAQLEMSKGPGRAKLHKARALYRQALEAARKSDDPEEARQLPEIEESLSALEELLSGPLGLPAFAGFGRGRMLDLDELYELFGRAAEFVDDDSDDEEEGPAGPPPPRPGRKPAPAAKRANPRKKR